jgi:ATP-dependent exoDNAse (exonuclease V) beta subunit
MKITFVSAGAGSGKTYRLTDILHDRLTVQSVRPSGVIATTFTVKAATELRERARSFLLARGAFSTAAELDQARIGTVNSVCGELLQRFAFEAKLPTEQQVLGEKQAPVLLARCIDAVRDGPQLQALMAVADRLGIESWEQDLKQLIDLVRANGVDPADLHGMAQTNADRLVAVLEKPAVEDLDAALISAIDAAEPLLLAAIEKRKVKKTQDYLDLCRDVRRAVREQRCAWSQWAKLSKAEPQAGLVDEVEPVAHAAGRHAAHPELHRDVRVYLQGLFELGQAVLGEFSERKRELGQIDFVDQERLLLGVLDHTEVQATLAEELDLLLVDEFQDTSPIQLALFLKLARLAREVVWVGDVKQAIYSFRGSDAALMRQVLQALPGLGGKEDFLDTSRRSRPSLVSLVNAVFVPAFAPELSERQVALRPHRPEPNTGAAFANWLLMGKNIPEQIAALGQGITELFASGRQVVDRHTGQNRVARFGDVAVLARSNERVTAVAAALTAQGIPAATAQPGLLQKPEVVLAMACLRRLIDAQDTVATAEILSLADCQAPETWLEDRLRYLQAGGSPAEWREAGAEAHPLLARIAQLRGQLPVLAPREALELVIAHADLARLVLQWSRSDEIARSRLANLDALIDLAGSYEDDCRSTRAPATVSGLIVWLQQQAADATDWLPEPELDAVKVLTHHGAKGLEWPIVILMDLDAEVKDRLWDLSAESPEQLDLNQPLKDRFIRYWPWPYGKQKNVQVADDIAQMPVAQRFREAAVAEAKRLLYVSMTRARDLLVFARPAGKAAGAWLKTLNAPWLLPKQPTSQLQLPDGSHVPYEHWELAVPGPVDAAADAAQPLHWFPPIGPRSERLPLIVSPSSAGAVGCEVVDQVRIGERIALRSGADMQRVGSAIHGCIAAAFAAHGALTAQAIGEVLSAWDADHVAPDDMLAQIDALRAWLSQRWAGARIHCEIPVEARRDNGQVLKGQIDLLVETPGGWVLLDHKSNPGSAATREEVVARYSGQLRLYKEGVERATGRPVVETWLYFPVAGSVMRVEL